MKTNIRRYIMSVFMLLAILSCRGTTGNTEEEGQAVVKINLAGIIQASDTSVSRSRMVSEVYAMEIPYNKDFNLVATITPEIPAAKINTRTSANPSALTITPQPPTTNPIGPNVKYLVMVFDENGNRITAQEKIYDSSNQSDTANQMILNAGKDYTFVAISYNTATAPTFNTAVTNLSDVTNTVSVVSSLDYLYFNSGPLNIIFGQQNYINITFKHINSRVILSVDATAEMGRITAIAANIAGTGSVNLAANGTTTSGTATSYNKSFTFPVLNTQAVTSSSVLVSSAGNAHVINITSVSTNGSPARTDVPAINVPVGTFQKGVSYKVNLSFQATGISIGGLIWARGNLAYDWVNKIYYNRYYPQETGSNYRNTDYWNFGSTETRLVPKKIINGWTDANTAPINQITLPIQDPCKLVAGGKWRMPTVSDFANLGVFKVHNGGDTSGANDGLSATTFAGGTAQPNGNITGNNFPYVYFDGTNEMGGTSVRLRFYAAGRYFGNFTTAQAAAGYQNGDNAVWTASNAQYMASDAMPYLTGADANVRAMVQSIVNGDSSGGNKTFVTRRGQPLDGANWSADDRVPIRCVKNP
ncbi:hypothetical protein ATB97_13155 [Elizabethkingia bruuniana]|nr:hypothetical protein [Elizabethkingia bruuniana]AQX83690.1 hypothetical protein AYC65_01040 [Elizabethkingia bruuniana]KGO09088.1 hypothetical protein KS04_16760 [Elizabethkingia miricola]KUY22195.1 hypothetical protein ATB97_13155 [Elizabethkingia bruuniana]OPB62406.1 hypothetical protein BAY12_10895 [Elizabethkingia bruuniana]